MKTKLILCCLLPFAFCLRALGQYSCDWNVISCGGGTSTGGLYSASGTIGQADAGGPQTGGNYSFMSGFWALYAGTTEGAAPVFLVEPLSQTVAEGANAVLSVSVSGQGPFTYQWRFDGTNLPGATSSTLVRSGITPDEAGNYAVLVSNSFGSAISSATGLRVLPFLGCAHLTNGLTLTWHGSFLLQTSTNVAGPYYDLPNASSPFVPAVASEQQRFYRLRGVTAGKLGPCSIAANGRFTASVTGLPGYNYVVQASTNLVYWIPLQTNPAPYQFIDSDTAGYPRRFYRTVLSP